MKYTQKALCSDGKERTVRTYTDIDVPNMLNGRLGNVKVNGICVSGILFAEDSTYSSWHFLPVKGGKNAELLPPPYHSGILSPPTASFFTGRLRETERSTPKPEVDLSILLSKRSTNGRS